jgi:hypothetical protein
MSLELPQYAARRGGDGVGVGDVSEVSGDACGSGDTGGGDDGGGAGRERDT